MREACERRGSGAIALFAWLVLSPPPPPPPPPPSSLPPLVNVKSTVHGSSVGITFDPYDGAKDYRVYVAPKDSDLIDGGPAIRNGIYRCAGDREAPRVTTDAEPGVPSGAVQTLVNHDVKGFTRTTSDATLGYVYPAAGSGLLPVYALGDPAPSADNLCFFQRWNESRVKKYTTSDTERAALLAAGWRDDGIAFYAPARGTAGTRVISTAVVDGAPLYFTEGAELGARASASPTAAFSALSAAADHTAPLMRVHYQNGCGRSHDELVAGQARFDRAVHQGNTPIPALLWTGLSGPTRLYIEALDAGCPFQGHLSPKSIPAGVVSDVNHSAYLSIADVQAASSTGEVYVNGQHDGTTPRAMAFAYVDVAPAAPEPFDFYDGFSDGGSPGPLTDLHETYFRSFHYDSQRYDISFYSMEDRFFALGSVLGELWVTYADWAADTNGKFRITPKQKATLAADSFVHATMEVDAVTTSRRYPQLWISDRDPPITLVLDKGVSIVVQTFGEWPPRIDIEFCDHRTWDVNNQCPRFPLQPDYFAPPVPPLPPHAEVGERSGVDRRNRFDVYASTSKVYVFLDGAPWGCGNLPAGKMPAGPVSITFGDVLYHSGVDVNDPPYTFHRKHLFIETSRHFGEFGIKSGVAAPAWDEGRLPCASNPQ